MGRKEFCGMSVESWGFGVDVKASISMRSSSVRWAKTRAITARAPEPVI